MNCSPLFKQVTGYLHGIAILIIAIFSAIQIYKLQNGDDSTYWIPLGITLMMILRLPNVICIALNDYHGWYVVVGSIIAIITNSYITHLLIIRENHRHHKK